MNITLQDLKDMYDGVNVSPMERSFTHRLQPEVDDNTVFATDMSTKNADGTLLDLSGNSNHLNMESYGRQGGYFSDGLYVANGDINKSEKTVTAIPNYVFIEMIITNYSVDSNYTPIVGAYNPSFTFGFKGGDLLFGEHGWHSSVDSQCILDYSTENGIKYHFCVLYDNSNKIAHFYVDGNFVGSATSVSQTGVNISESELYIGYRYVYGDFNIDIAQIVFDSYIPDTQIKSRFNALATLPLYTFDATKYPTSSGWTALVPYSTVSIVSGEFSFTDSGQMQCDTAGSFTLRNAHEFDGDEYIKLTINGVEYTGTGTVTNGTTTVSITQGSTLIDVDMGTGDVIDSIDIQFREPVE